MTQQILLVRHAAHAEVGRVLTGRADIALSGEGRVQARALGMALRGREVAIVHHSPRVRCRETATIIADALGIEAEEADALDEVDFGAWTGRPFATLEADPVWRLWNAERSRARAPRGESMAEAAERAVTYVEALAASGRGTALCVSHCDIIRGIVAHHLGLGLDHLLRFDVDPASVSTLLVGAWGGRVLRLNEVHA